MPLFVPRETEGEEEINKLTKASLILLEFGGFT